MICRYGNRLDTSKITTTNSTELSQDFFLHQGILSYILYYDTHSINTQQNNYKTLNYMNYRYVCLPYNRIRTFFAPYIIIWPFVKGCNIHSQNQPKHEKCPTIIGKLSINLDRAVGFSFMPGLFYTAYHHSCGLLGRQKTRPPI